jgi:hypothetical protein
MIIQFIFRFVKKKAAYITGINFEVIFLIDFRGFTPIFIDFLAISGYNKRSW